MTQMTFAGLDKIPSNNGAKKGNAVILPPMDIFESIELIKSTDIKPRVTMLDPWYNKGFGEIRPDYNDFVISILEALIGISDHVFLWGFPEIVAQYFNRIPTEYQLVAWLTWYYKNNPSVLSDSNEEYISIVESRLLYKGIQPNKTSPSMLTTTLQA